MATLSTNVKTQFDLTNEIINTVSEEKGLTKIDKTVLVHLSFHMKKNKYGNFDTIVSHKTIGKLADVHYNTVGKSLSKMETLGYLHGEMRFDTSKIYTWLGFEATKTIEALNFKMTCQDKQERVRGLKKVRGEILGRNNAKFKELMKYAETLKQNGYPEDSERVVIRAFKVKEATQYNTYFKDYEPYKELLRPKTEEAETVPTMETFTCDDCGSVLDEGFCVNPDCDYLPF